MLAHGDQAASAHGGTGEAERSALLRSVFDESPLAILRVTRPGGRLGITVDANPAAARFLGRSPADVIGARVEDLLPGILDAPVDGAPEVPTSLRLLAAGGDGDRWVDASVSPLSAHDPTGQPLALVVLQDVTEQWTTRARLDREARQDPLTGLINRGELLRQLGALDPQSDGPHVAVIFLDLDGFKMVNDTRGHQAGDELLVAVARRIRAAVRPEDSLARIGGDEFVVLCPRLADPLDVRAVAERVRATLDDPVSVDGRSHRISMSVGISVARADAIDPADLLRQADMAMYRAKDAGRNTVRL
ncbi:MAG TPA: diguanylate cyclase, partial [Candidatus Limnocylindrales bacterium]|nr:diguanylate cyclase [Candidatus Limnocylindrales bacterium]